MGDVGIVPLPGMSCLPSLSTLTFNDGDGAPVPDSPLIDFWNRLLVTVDLFSDSAFDPFWINLELVFSRQTRKNPEMRTDQL